MSHSIEIITGEHRDGTKKSVRSYLFYVSPTGKETALKDCPYLKRSSMRPKGEFGTGDRTLLAEYTVEHPVVLKLWTDCTNFGKPKKMKSIFIEVGEMHPEISLTGFEGFGLFKGHGKVLLQQSVIDTAQLEADFSYEVLRAPITANQKSTRSLVFLRRK